MKSLSGFTSNTNRTNKHPPVIGPETNRQLFKPGLARFKLRFKSNDFLKITDLNQQIFKIFDKFGSFFFLSKQKGDFAISQMSGVFGVGSVTNLVNAISQVP